MRPFPTPFIPTRAHNAPFRLQPATFNLQPVTYDLQLRIEMPAALMSNPSLVIVDSFLVGAPATRNLRRRHPFHPRLPNDAWLPEVAQRAPIHALVRKQGAPRLAFLVIHGITTQNGSNSPFVWSYLVPQRGRSVAALEMTRGRISGPGSATVGLRSSAPDNRGIAGSRRTK